jgi:membrane protease YdiL (CAAX protease family)
MRSLFERHPLATYYWTAVAIAIAAMGLFFAAATADPAAGTLLETLRREVSASGYVNIISIARFAAGPGHRLTLLIFLYAAAPTLAALAWLAIGRGRSGVLEWLQRLRPTLAARPDYRPYLAFGLAFLATVLGSLLYARSAPGFGALYARLGGSIAAVIGTALLGLLIDDGATLEEMGWRGYVQPLLLARWRSPLRVGIVLGILWAAWHAPRDLPALLGGDLSTFVLMFLYQSLLAVPMSVVIVVMTLRTGGSVWPGILVHAADNFLHKAGLVEPLYAAAIPALHLEGLFMPGFLLRGVIWTGIATVVVIARQALTRTRSA